MKSTINNAAVGPQTRIRRSKRRLFLPLLSAASIVAGLQTATQIFAHSFNYHPSLGSNLSHAYAPWAILRWANNWYGVYPEQFIYTGSAGVIIAAVGLLSVAFAQVMASNRAKGYENLYGSARWAEKKDIQDAGLLPRKRSFLALAAGENTPASDGVYVGGWVDRDGKFYYLRHSGPEHVLTYAPTRSGKGVGIVIPTLLSWPHSTIITDLKGELWALTAGWRQKYAKNKVLRFEPAANDGGICWNPLDEIRIGTEHEVGDVQNLAMLIVDPDGRGLDSHWQRTSHALLVGVILHALYRAKNDGTVASLPVVDTMLADPHRDSGELWKEMIAYCHCDGQNHPAVGSAARDMMDRSREEASSVLSTAKSYLALYRDPVVAYNVSKSEFRIKDLMDHEAPVSLYIVTKPNDKGRLRPLVRVLTNMIIRLLADKLSFVKGKPVASHKHRLLAMLDEFPSLGKLEILQESLAFLAGYGIKCYLICQDLNQLKNRETGYGPDETITSNCHIQNAYPPNRIETAEHLSRLTGQTTVVKEQLTTSGRRVSAMLSQVSRTIQEVQRPLLTPDECLRMPGPIKNAQGDIETAGDMVIYVAGYPAIYGKQPLYFKDPVFLARASVTAPQCSDKLCVGTATQPKGDDIN
ncbi:MAG: type IV secretory system conjugative DNA transfer family protein [Vibrionaceae bacterium]